VKTVVSNTGPILHLIEADILSLLSLTGEVYIPSTVFTEVKHHNPQWQIPDWIVVVKKLIFPYNKQAKEWCLGGFLDVGEAEAIALAKQVKADWFLTDDAAARLFANTLGLEVHGSLGIVLWTASVGHLDYAKAETALNRLAQSTLWISPQVLDEAKAVLKKIFNKR
jgi:predicted nucleic acid-binding protein